MLLSSLNIIITHVFVDIILQVFDVIVLRFDSLLVTQCKNKCFIWQLFLCFLEWFIDL